VIGEDRLELRSEVRQALGQRFGRVGLELAVGEMRQAIAVGADDPPAGGAQPGIKAENQRQASFSSSSSGTS
jgi:hypothetical protein